MDLEVFVKEVLEGSVGSGECGSASVSFFGFAGSAFRKIFGPSIAIGDCDGSGRGFSSEFGGASNESVEFRVGGSFATGGAVGFIVFVFGAAHFVFHFSCGASSAACG